MGAQPADFQRYLTWLGGHGITDFVVHLWQYRLNSHAIRDWPSSSPNHIGWPDAFPQLLEQTKPEMIAAAKRSGVDNAEMLVVSPHRGVMAAFLPSELLTMNVHDARSYADTPAGRINDRFMAIIAKLQTSGVAYHIADERTFEEGGVSDDRFHVGNCSYKTVLIPEDCVLQPPGRSLVTSLRTAGMLAIGSFADVEVLSDADRAGTKVESQTLPVKWALQLPQRNQMLLEPAPAVEQGRFVAKFSCDSELGDLAIFFADDVEAAALNGQRLTLRSETDGCVANIPKAAIVAGDNEVTFSVAIPSDDPQRRPFAWITGEFACKSATPFADGPNATVRTEGPFHLVKSSAIDTIDLTAAGFAFARQPIEASATLEFPPAVSSIRLTGTTADAAHVTIDEIDCGYTWGPDWLVILPKSAPAGTHEIKLKLIPSAYNTFGPHHHVDGDRHVVSPMQFLGIKNFADRADAPTNTLVSRWHFKPLLLPTAVELVDAP